jgi:hypothetical protein
MRHRRALATVFVAAVTALVMATPGLPSRLAEGAAAASVADPVVAVVGDFACDPAGRTFAGGLGVSTACRQAEVSQALLDDPTVGGVLGLGDFQYDCGDLADYEVSYTPTWGRVNDRLVPVAGNHEYKTGKDKFGVMCPASNSVAASYFEYFGSAAHPESDGHFSFDLGSWHLVGLNANCAKSGVGGCAATSSQTRWLEADLAATVQPCVAAFWHQPYLTGRKKGKLDAYRPWWQELYNVRADLVLNGHVHNYQRYVARDPSGAPDHDGITEYVVGTGGESLVAVPATASPMPSVWKKSFGYARLTLRADGWDMDFVNASGAVLDSSSGTCH